MVATRTKRRKPKRLTLHEDVMRGLAPLANGQARVDREKAIIHGVKVLGRDSVNNRRYTLEAVQEAYQGRLYEGLAVYVDHPAKPGDPRPVRSKFGRVCNIRIIEGELFGDLEYLKSHPEAALITEAAERMPEQFGLSHNAQGEGEEDASGIFVVRKIVEVRSVDVVTEPATTNGLFEQRQAVKVTIKKLFENSWKKFSRKCTKRPKLAAYMKRLVEDDNLGVMDTETEEEDVPADHEEALKGGFEQSVAAITKQCLDGEMDCKDGVKQIGELLKAHSKLTEEDDEEKGDMEEEEEKPKEGEKGNEEKETEEQKRLKQLERKDKARDLCEEMGIACDKVLLEALTALSDEKAMKRLLEREKKSGAGKGNTGGARSGSTESTTQRTTTLEGVNTPEGAMAVLLG